MMVKYSFGLLMTKKKTYCKQRQAIFLSLETLASEYNTIVGHGGAQAVRESFDIPKSEMRVRPKTVAVLTLSLPSATAVEFTVHCQTRLQSNLKGTVDSSLFLTVLRNANLCSLFQNVRGYNNIGNGCL